MSEVKEENGEVAEKREWKGIIAVLGLSVALVVGFWLKADAQVLTIVATGLATAVGYAAKTTQ